MAKKNYKYSCESCHFYTNKLSNYNKHLTTRKHKNGSFLNKKEPKEAIFKYTCENCGKNYKARNSFWYHKKKCVQQQQTTSVPLSSNEKKLEKENAELKQMVFNVMEKMSQQQKTIEQLVPKVGNNNNNQFNINVFLNEKCKDALNISDFVNRIHIGMSELDYATNKGLIEGVSNILTKNLNKIEIEKRPIHCTDVKNRILYIKDKNEWNKNDEQIVSNTIKNVKNKHIEAMQKWENENPDWRTNIGQTGKYMELIKKSTEELDDEEKDCVLTAVSKETEIK